MVLNGELVLFPIPDFLVVARFAPRPQRQDDAVKHQLPNERVFLDDARIGEELFQVSAHGHPIGCIRRAEIDEKHADAVFNRRRLARHGGFQRGLGGRHGSLGDRSRQLLLARRGGCGCGRRRLDRACRSVVRRFGGRQREGKMFGFGGDFVDSGHRLGRSASMPGRDSLGGLWRSGRALGLR